MAPERRALGWHLLSFSRGSCTPVLYLDLDLIRELFGEAMQLPSGGVQSPDHHPQSGPAFPPAMHGHGKVVLGWEPERRLGQTPNMFSGRALEPQHPQKKP